MNKELTAEIIGIAAASATAALGVILLFGCSTPTPNPRSATPEEIKIAVQTRVAYGLRDYPQSESYLIYAVEELRAVIADPNANLAPEAVRSRVDFKAHSRDWPGNSQVQAQLIFHDALGWYIQGPDPAENRRRLLAISDGITFARQIK